MENPFSPEQIKKLNELAKLPTEEQRVRLQQFLQTLTPEQVEYLKQQQGENGSCPFCMISEGKIKSKVVYSDDYLIGALDIRPANKGHVVLFSKKHYPVLASMPNEEVGHLFDVANKLSQVIYENLKCQGTNLLVANGEAAGQKVDHVVVHIIPRYNNDKVVLNWESVKVDEKEMQQIENALKGKVKVEKVEKEEKAEKEEVKREKTYYEEERIP